VIQYLHETHPDHLDKNIFEPLRRWVPRLDSVIPQELPDGRLLLQLKDAPFKQPILARFASDGTLKMLAYLVLLHDPNPPRFIGVEEPENFLHPRLLRPLADECRNASALTQLLVTTHSPFFLDGLQAREVRILYRDEHGFTQAKRAADVAGIAAFMAKGATLGELWMEQRFGVGDPLAPAAGSQGA
jgi:predicted ATPase